MIQDLLRPNAGGAPMGRIVRSGPCKSREKWVSFHKQLRTAISSTGTMQLLLLHPVVAMHIWNSES